MNSIIFPAEWMHQDAILLCWPHKNSDWAVMLEEIRECYLKMIQTIVRFEEVILLVAEKDLVPLLKNDLLPHHVRVIECPTNDTWTRDFGPLIVLKNQKPMVLDFKFNGWGLKYASDKDNLVTRRLFEAQLFKQETTIQNHLNFVLEGGSIESDGKGTIMATSTCLLSPNRNGGLEKDNIEKYLTRTLGLKRILWLNHGFLAGDDTDHHIDTLARFCDSETIAYVTCLDESDEHFSELKLMEKELHRFRTREGKPYRLIPLPMADAIYDRDHRLPATYANFLILNSAVLVPFYGSKKDQIAQSILQKVFPNREITGIDCRPLIKQNGSLHCATMQLPEGIIKPMIKTGPNPVIPPLE